MGLLSIFKKTNNLYYPGCYSYFKHKEFFDNYKKIFSRLGIDFKTISKKVCCGLPALETGYDSEARKLARRNFEIMKEEGITSIITNSPCCYKMFLQDYPKLLPDWNIEVKNIWKILYEKLYEIKDHIKNRCNGSVAYQDSCYLGRYCNIYDEPRLILELLGYNIKEMYDTRENSICCGSCGGLVYTNSELADEIARERIMQARRAGVYKIIASSVGDYDILKKNSKGLGVEILELSEVIAFALGLKIEGSSYAYNEESIKEELEDVNQDEAEQFIKIKDDDTNRILKEAKENMRFLEEIE
ncbi:MAG: (Fe-S)-binding protein [Nanoarchaeota archaeon]|nr:(Fe-S)-binding protein [Nanoarchaeota archaeon]